MPFVTLKFSPGVNKDGTDYGNATGWFDTQLVRFRGGNPEKIGGWAARTTTAVLGTCRRLLPWTLRNGKEHVAIGTSQKLYVEESEEPVDITPIRASSTINSNPFAISSGSALVTVTDTGHGAYLGDYVTFSGCGSTGDGALTAAVINAEQVITSVADANTFTFTASASAASVTSSVGGASVVAAYQISVGLDVSVRGTGWGVGPWGGETWGEAREIGGDVTLQQRLWSFANFGEDLVAGVYDGSIYYWDASGGTTSRAVNITSLAGSDTAPTISRGVLFSSEYRHLMTIGCDPYNDIGTQDKTLVRWSDRESLTTWTPDTDNTAGSLKMSTGSEIITGIASKREVLIWTDISLNTISYIGAPDWFGTRLLASNVSIMGPNAVIQADDIVYWMGRENFYMYDGAVKVLPCPLSDHVFSNVNKDQPLNVFVGLNRSDNEIWFFYPVAGGDEVSNYVIFNYLQNIWYNGTLVRTAWADASVITDYPIAASTDGKIYHHELGLDDGTSDPASAITAYAESSSFEPIPSDGYQYFYANRLLPDLTFSGSTAASPAVSLTLTPKDFPGGNPTQGGAEINDSVASTVTRTAASPEVYTSQSHIRLRARSVKYKISSSATGVQWRNGNPRLEVRPDGRQ